MLQRVTGRSHKLWVQALKTLSAGSKILGAGPTKTLGAGPTKTLGAGPTKTLGAGPTTTLGAGPTNLSAGSTRGISVNEEVQAHVRGTNKAKVQAFVHRIYSRITSKLVGGKFYRLIMIKKHRRIAQPKPLNLKGVFMFVVQTLMKIAIAYAMRPKPLRRPKREAKKPDFDSYELQSDSTKIFDKIQALIKALLPTEQRDTLLGLSIISSILTLLLSIYQVTKRRSFITCSILATSVATLILNVLALTGVKFEEDHETILESITPLSNILIDPYDERIVQWMEKHDAKGNTSSDEDAFLEDVKKLEVKNKKNIIDLWGLKYQNKVVLPINNFPAAVSRNNVQDYHDSFRYPNWFLRMFYLKDYVSLLSQKRRGVQTLQYPSDTVQYMRNFIDQAIKTTNTQTPPAKLNDQLYYTSVMPCGNVRKYKCMADLYNPSVSDDDEVLSEKQTEESEYSESESLASTSTNRTINSLSEDEIVHHLATLDDETSENMIEGYECESAVDILAILKRVSKRMVCLFIYLFEVLTTKQKFSITGVLKCFRLMEDINREESEIKELYSLIVGDETPATKLTKRMEQYRKAFDDFMETPTFKIAERPTIIYAAKRELEDFNKNMLTLSKEIRQDYVSLSQLALMVNARIHKYFQNDIKKLTRQEPFVVLIQGPPGSGKTSFARKLARDICDEVLSVDYSLNYVEVTPDDKYWPPFQGQSVALFDDCASHRDFKDDLLMRNMKNICAPTMFNAAGADVDHKINPIAFRVIFATTNTDFKEIGTRITAMYDAVSAEAYMRRMICIQASWNEQKAGILNPSEPWNNTYLPNDEHLTFHQMEYDKGNIKQGTKLNRKSIIDLIKARENHHNQTFTSWLRQCQMEPQAGHSKTHYSIVLHGRAGQGKTECARRLMEELSISLNLPAYYVSDLCELQKLTFRQKCVLVLDDIVRTGITLEEENILMTLYNSTLKSDSIIIWTTNISPSKALPTINESSITTQRWLPFENEGLARRMGFNGFFRGVQQPSTGLEIRTNNMRYYRVCDQTALTFQMIMHDKKLTTLIGFLFILHAYLTYVPFLFALAFFYFRTLEIELKFQELPEYCFESYRNYLRQRSDLEVEYVSRINRTGQYNFMVDCKNSADFMQVSSMLEADKHVFFELDPYYQSTKDWKIYMSREVMVEMQKNLERYFLSDYSLDETNIISMISRYVQAFVAANIEPRFYAVFNDVGEFEYTGGKLSIRRDTSIQNEAAEEPKLIFLGSEWKVFYLDNYFTFGDMLTLDIPKCMNLGFSFAQSKTIFEFKNSKVLTQNLEYLSFLRKRTKEDIKAKVLVEAKIIKDKFIAFSKHPFGIISIVLGALFVSVTLIYLLKKLFSSNKMSDSDSDSDSDYDNQRKKGRKGSPKKKSYDSDDDKINERKKGRKGSPKKKSYDSDDDQEKERKKGRKGSPKKKSYDSDDDKAKERKKGRKGSPKKRSYDSDDDKEVEDVLKLADMNDFRALKPYFNVAYTKARVNLCMVYTSDDTAKVLSTEPDTRICYGLFIKDTMLVTVGHITTDCKNKIYIGKDEFNGKFHKATFVSKPHNRDISIWKVEGISNQPDISSFFLKDAIYNEDDEWNAVLQRFAPGKEQEFHTSVFRFWKGPDTFARNGQLMKYGEADYAVFAVKLTDGGDCGLPYYIAETSPILSNKILGIHCMGNVLGAKTSGILSVITQEDIKEWTKLYQKKKESACKFCTNDTFTAVDDNPKCLDHRTVWHKSHNSSWSTFVEEFYHYIGEYPKFTGGLIKNSGSMKGTQEHSHTQFLPFVTDVVDTDISSWKTIKLEDMCKTLKGPASQITVDILETSFMTYIKKYHKYGNDFRIRAYRYISKNKLDSSHRLRLQITVLELEEQKLVPQVNGIPLTSQNKHITFNPHFGSPIHVDPAVHAVLQGAINNRERGKLEDVPFCDVSDNQTVRVIGSFSQSKSHTPANHYKLSPFSNVVKDLIPLDKAPCEYDIAKIPPEIVANLVENRYGQPCQRSTLSLCWAHPIVGNRMDLKEIKEEFRIKIKSFYKGLRLLSDEEVLEGIKSGHYAQHIGGMELDTSIGFTMKELFYVTKKSDVITCDENGKYSWLSNPAATFLKSQYDSAKALSDKGNKYFTVFLELLKMEKLKIEGGKNYKGRTFVAQDVLGVLMERRNLGHLCAKAYKDDPNCGIGVDPIKTFNQIYIRLNRFKNIWAGDYKNYDRNTPAVVQEMVTELLCEENPNIANQIRATMRTNIERIQVSGTTLFEVLGGMPSGCFTTAALNSLNNEFLMYSCFHFLCLEHGEAPSWKLYNDNVERIFYGDDVFISVSENFKEIFTRANVSLLMKSYFGMVLDSSAKDGSDSTFDNYETASWISRYFRKLGKYEIVVGALKKISIHANFHYVSSITTEHLGTLMERAQWEAALWEPEYFDKIQQAILRCIAIRPALSKYVQTYSQKVLHKQMFESAIATAFPYSKELSWADEVEETASLLEGLNFFKKYLFKSKYMRIIKMINNKQLDEQKVIRSAGSYTMMLNNMSQTGKISKPTYTYTSTGPSNEAIWYCNCFTTLIATCKPFMTKGQGARKAEAAENAAYEMLVILGFTNPRPIKQSLNYKDEQPKPSTSDYQPECFEIPVKSIFGWHYNCCPWSKDYCTVGPDSCPCARRRRTSLRYKLEKLFKCMEPQMNVSSGTVGKTPQAPMVATDVSVVADSGLFTNTMVPTPTRIFNQCAIALDNPAGSGAPFDKRTSIYNIYQRWEDNNTTISPSMSAGSRILTLSLDPMKLPTYIKEYVLFHESMIPALDISISIAGAAGTIGWIATGWVKDGSKQNITLNDLQQISMETSNMNGTQIIHTKLTDVRRTGMFRKVRDDPEPYPAIVMLIDHAVTNVQRNDSVNYPVRVQVRLAPECILMEPFTRGSDLPTLANFNLGSYFYDEGVDALVGTSSVAEEATNLIQWSDMGFNTDDFKPRFAKTPCAVVKNWNKEMHVMCAIQDKTPDAAFLEQIQNLTNKPTPVAAEMLPPSKIIMAYGLVEQIPNYYENEEPSLIGSVYSVAGHLYISNLSYNITQAIVQPRGCYLVAELEHSIQKLKDTNFLVCLNVLDQTWDQAWSNGMYNPEIFNIKQMAVLYKDKNHNNEAIGDLFDIMQPKFSNKVWTSYADWDLDKNFIVWIQTGNTMPSTNLPTGLKQLCFVRSGTTTKVTTDVPFVPVNKPLLNNAVRAFAELLAEHKITTAKGNLVIDGENKGQIGYNNGVFFVRTDNYKKLLPRIGNDVKITEISQLSSPQALTAYNTTSFGDWITQGNRRTRKMVDFSSFEPQSMIAGGLLMGLGQGIGQWGQQAFQSSMLDKMNKANMAIQGANNAAIAQRQKDAFERNLQLTGYNSSSAQYGGLIGPRQEHQINVQPYNTASGQGFLRGETLFQKAGTQGEVSFDDKGNSITDVTKSQLPPELHDVTKMSDNAAFIPAPRNQPIENQAVDDLEPIDPALDKDKASTTNNTIVHADKPGPKPE